MVQKHTYCVGSCPQLAHLVRERELHIFEVKQIGPQVVLEKVQSVKQLVEAVSDVGFLRRMRSAPPISVTPAVDLPT